MKLKRFLKWILKLAIILYLLVFVLIPIIFHFSYPIQRGMLFLNYINLPSMDFSKPETIGLAGTRNFYLKTHENISIGTWHILPHSLLHKYIENTKEAFESALRKSKHPIFIYMHGNGGNRASSHRVELYKLLQNLDYHVIAFDYRGYGDSDDAELSEQGVVNDGKYVIEWVNSIVNNEAPIFVWGHSLGTGVSTEALSQLVNKEIVPSGLILEGAFNNINDEASEFPLAKIFKHVPWFHWAFVQPFYDNNLRFETDKNIAKVQSPILMLHAYDDNIIPFKLAEKLYTAAVAAHANDKLKDKITFVKIDASYGVYHNFICRFLKLPEILRKFVTDATQENTT